VSSRDGAPPLFVVGTGRSGTTACYEFLCSHPDTTWLSNWSQRFPPLARLHPRGTEAGKERPGARWAFRPVEGYRVFDRALVRDGPHLVARSPERLRALRRALDRHRVPGRRDRPPVLVSKNTRNSRAVPTLGALYPDARFVHLVRDPVATVSSLVRVAFFPTIVVEWEGAPTRVADAAARGADPVALAARIWEEETRLAATDLAGLAPDRVLRLRYEDLVASPRAELTRVCGLAGLDPARHPGFDRRAAELVPRSDPPAPDPTRVATVWSVCGATAATVGYDAPA
jgi:hypothetical protein